MKQWLHHLFLPHHTNNQRAKILHHNSLVIITAFFLYQAFLFPKLIYHFPQVLGTSIDISSQELLLLTNQKRQEAGVSPLVLNDQLTQAAKMKADDMFAHNFWAHNDPNGATPWDFVKKANYNYIYAGENLARGFTDTTDVINAWMASPDHRENMLSPNYRDIGFAIAQGNLTGEKNTVLVVEMFGSTQLVPEKTVLPGKTSSAQSMANNANPAGNQLLSSVKNEPYINTLSLTKTVAFSFVTLFISILLLDIVIIQRRNIVRVFEHNVDHVMFFVFILLILSVLGRGFIY